MSMPSHKIHIGIGQEVSKNFRYDKDLFLIGCILPDLGDNHFISHFKKTHKYYDIAEFIMNRYDKNDPVMVGYLVHLLTDDFYNNYVRMNKFIYDENHKVKGIITNSGIFYGTPKEITDKKQDGFYEYEHFLLNRKMIEKINDVDVDRITRIKECNFDKDYIKEYIDKHNSDIEKEYPEPKFEIFNFEELDNLYDDTIHKIKNFLKNINNVENKRKLYYN